MKIVADLRLFWFMRAGVVLDLEEPSLLDLYVQQVLTHGGVEDVRALLMRVARQQLAASLGRVKPFLPIEVRRFWEDYLADP